MKNKISFIIASCLLAFTAMHVQAQQKETAVTAKGATSYPDSLHLVLSSVVLRDTAIPVNTLKATSSLKTKRTAGGYIVKDTVYLQAYSVSALDTGKYHIVYQQKDSLYKLMVPLYKMNDTTRKKPRPAKLLPDTAVHAKKYKTAESVLYVKSMEAKMDSLQKQQYRLYASDSLRAKKIRLFSRADSLYKMQGDLLVSADTLQRKKYTLQLRADSLRIKKYLDEKQHQQKIILKSVSLLSSGYRPKKILLTVPCMESDTLFIKNNYKKVRIITSSKPSLSITTTFYFKDSVKFTDEELLGKMGIRVKRNKKNITVTVDGLNTEKPDSNDPFKPLLNLPANTGQGVTIEVPANVTVVIHSSNTETTVDSYVKNLKTQIINGSLKMINAGNATFKADYCTITAGNIQNAELHMFSSKLSAVNIGEAKITSGASEIKLDECKSLTLEKSSGDEITLGKAGSITGKKDFGILAVTSLLDTIALSGKGTAVNVKRFTTGTSRILINSKYADVKLPLSGLSDYALYYEGSFNDVNRTVTATNTLGGNEKMQASFSVMKDSLNKEIKNQNNFKTILKANAGNITAGHTKIDIVCPYCNVVFN